MKPVTSGYFWLAVLLAGCNPLFVRTQSPEDLESLLTEAELVGDLAVAANTAPVAVEAIGLVTGLSGTGSDPAPSPERAEIIAEMQTRGVAKPNRVLESPDTAVALVVGYLRPGIQKGDRFDIEVRVPSQSETTSLRNGWLMECRLRERRIFGAQIHDGPILALCEGPILIDPGAERDENGVMANRGRILGGGVALKSRPLQLVLRPENRDVRTSDRIGKALNQRFHTFSSGIKTGVATPKTDEYIELIVHPRYKDNVQRYLQVVRSVAVSETSAERIQRLDILERQLLDPVTAATAALRLEAIGSDAIDTLRQGLEANDPEVRFFAAEALAYLDDSEATPALGDAARDEPAFRVFALTALSAMDDFAAYEELHKLLAVNSAETRYGAFRSLWAMNPHDSVIKGEMLGDQFSYHVLDVGGPPMVHVTRSYRPEIVLFGKDQQFATPLTLDAGKSIMINAREGDEHVTVSRFSVSEPDQKRVVSTRVDDVIRAIVELGGTYPDVVQALQQAVEIRSLTTRFEVDALPRAGRSYERGPVGDGDASESAGDSGSAEDEASDDAAREANPLDGVLPPPELESPHPTPELFSEPQADSSSRPPGRRTGSSSAREGEPTAQSGWLGRIWARRNSS